MLKAINKVPAGTFLVPMLLSALFYTFWPNLFNIGGITEALFSGSGLQFILGAISFCSGTGINVARIGQVMKRHGVLMLVKIVMTIVLGLLAINVLGEEGILGVSTVAIVVAISSTNPALYLSLVNDFGNEDDTAAFGLYGLFSIPILPILVYSLASTEGGGIDLMPIVSTLLPLIIGIVLGNIDKNIGKLFTPGIGLFIPLMGWNIGQGLDLLEATKSGIYGVLVVLIFYIANAVIFATDTKLLKQDGIASLASLSIAGVSISAPRLLAVSHIQLAPYATEATAQLLTAVVITSIITPILVRRLYVKRYGADSLAEVSK